MSSRLPTGSASNGASPVTLVLRDLPPAIVLHMGADARALVIY
jgi:hypothetical protein